MVVQARGDKWIVKRQDGKVQRILNTQSEAINCATKIAINSKCELWVYRADGSIRSKDSFPAPAISWNTLRFTVGDDD